MCDIWCVAERNLLNVVKASCSCLTLLQHLLLGLSAIKRFTCMKLPWLETPSGFIFLTYTNVPKDIIYTNYSDLLCER